MERFFLGGNTGRGFAGYYTDERERADRVFLIKGGPGTGKSSLMKKIGKKCAERGLDHELWYCSGDPSSLDGVLIKELGVLVTDATVPHATEARLPGLRDCLVDMGQALNGEKLRQRRDEIEKLLNVKKSSYNHAYEHLNRALSYNKKKFAAYSEVADVAAIRREAAIFALRMTDGCVGGDGRGSRDLFTRAITAEGVVGFFDYLVGKRVFRLKASESGVQIFCGTAAELVGNVTRARFPLCPDITEGIFNGAFAVTGDAGVFETAADVIDLSEAEGNAAFACEFYRSREQEEIAYAIKDFAAARNAHAETEKYFVEAMDFGIADELAEDVSRMIFGQ